jgi:hypothetical protein
LSECGLHLCARTLREIAAHRRSHGAPDAQLDAELARVQRLMNEIQAGGGGDIGGSCSSGGGSVEGGCSASGAAGGGSDCNGRSRGSSGADGGSSTAAAAGPSSTWPYALSGLAHAAPHLAPGQNLTHLEG